MHIRKATTEDIDALGALLSRSRQVSGTGHEISMGAEGQTYSEVDLRQVIEGEDNAIYLAIDGDDLIGCTIVRAGEPGEVFVDESHLSDPADTASMESRFLAAAHAEAPQPIECEQDGRLHEEVGEAVESHAETGTYSYDDNPYDVADADDEEDDAHSQVAHQMDEPEAGDAVPYLSGDDGNEVPYVFRSDEDDAVPYTYSDDTDDYAVPYSYDNKADDDAVPYGYDDSDEDDAVPYSYGDGDEDDAVPYSYDEGGDGGAAYVDVPKTAYSDAAAAARNEAGMANPYGQSLSPDSPSYYRRGRPPIPERPRKKKGWNVTFTLFFIALIIALGVLGGLLMRQFVFVSAKVKRQAEQTPVAAVANQRQDASEDEPSVGESGKRKVEGTVEATQPTEAAYTCEPAQVNLMMVGDILMHDEVVNAGYQPDGTFNYDFLYAEIVPWLEEADLKILNQETVMGSPSLGYRLYMGAAGPIMNTPTALADSEVRYGFNCILKATNHSLDLGYAGLQHELDYWYANYPNTPVIGANNPSKAFTDDQSQNWVDNVYVVDIDGLKVGVLNYTWATNESFDWETDHAVISYMSEDKIAADVEKARLNGAEFIVACPHWGIEYSTEPSYEEYYYSKIFCDLGVDVIFGCHPHVLQPVEVLTNEEGHQTVCFYSMSNFVCASIMVDNSFIGGIARATLTRDEHGGYAVTAASLIPTVIHYAYDETMRPYPLAAYTNEMASNSMRPAVTPGYAYDFCANVFGDGFDRDLGFFILDLPQEGRRV